MKKKFEEKTIPPGKKIVLQYKCRRCGVRYFDPTITYLQRVAQILETSSLMTTLHNCDDNRDEANDRFGIADLVGCKVEDKE